MLEDSAHKTRDMTRQRSDHKRPQKTHRALPLCHSMGRTRKNGRESTVGLNNGLLVTSLSRPYTSLHFLT